MNRFFRILVSSSALLGALAVLPGVANAAEPDRPAPPASVDRDRDHDGGRGWDRGDGRDRDGRWDGDRPGYDRDWRQDRAERERVERERAEHDRACHVAWERGASPDNLRAMRCY